MLRCISPVDGGVYAERAVSTVPAASGVIAAAREAQIGWRSTPIEKRIEIVMRGVSALVRDHDAATLELAWMMGRPVRYSGEFGGVVERSEYMASIATRALAPLMVENSPQFKRMIAREPWGVVLVVAPWNYPYLTAINTIIPALIAGNAVVIKPATQTLLAGERLANAFQEAGLPEGLVQNLYLDHETTSALISRRAFDFVNFTGSVNGGRAIEQAAAGTFTPLGLELGGKDPAYVMEDADLANAVASLMDGAFYNSGQCCCGIERIYVAPTVYDEFVERSIEEVKKLRLGNPLVHDTSLGPMANKRFAAEVRTQIAESIAAGAVPHIDARHYDADDGVGAYLAPQLLTNVDHTMRVMRDESFGPVVGIMRAKDEEEAIALMNDSEFGLTASLWTKDPLRAERLANRLETGTVFLNRCDYLDPAMCWTGCKNTGRGATLSELGYASLTRPKSHHFRLASV